MKSAILCVLLCLCAGVAHADYSAIIIKKNGGETSTFVLGEMPKLTFDETNLIIETENVKTAIPLKDIKEYGFETFPSSGVKTIGSAKEPPFSYDGNTLCFNVMEGMTNHVDIFRIDGLKISSVALNENASTTLDCSSWPQGIYIISINGHAYKLMKL